MDMTPQAHSAGPEDITSRSLELRALADHYVAELAQHPVLSVYWSQIALVLKGSVARGNADNLSDIDFVFFADADTRRAIVEDYRRVGLTTRRDGVFMPLGNWDGHYHFESYDHLRDHFALHHFPHIWEFLGAVPLHDPRGGFGAVMHIGMAALFGDPLADVRAAYLDLQLTLDWLRHPLKRGDAVSAWLHCAHLIQGICQISYLLDARPYPHDKWLAHYLDTTRFGRAHAQQIRRYLDTVAEQRAVPVGRQLDEYPQYREAADLIAAITSAIQDGYGEQVWLKEWYLYV